MELSKSLQERRYDIDWLRNFGILLLFPYHAARIFDIWGPNYIKSTELSPTLSSFLLVAGYCFMPLLFFLAGASSWYALKKRSAAQYSKDRFYKLLIPFLFGLLIIVPPQAYLAKITHSVYNGDYITFMKGYFTDFTDLTGYLGTFTPGHLWFILYLFIISMVALPIMIKSHNKPPIKLLRNPWIMISLFIPLTLMEFLPDLGGKNPFFFFFLFLVGFFLGKDAGVMETIHRIKFKCLLFLLPLVPGTMILFQQNSHAGDFSAVHLLITVLKNLGVCLTLIVLIGYGNKCLNHDHAMLHYMNQAAFPVYILHQTVMMVVGYYTVKINAGISVRYILITFLTLILSIILYEIIRRIPGLRRLFGIKPTSH